MRKLERSAPACKAKVAVEVVEAREDWHSGRRISGSPPPLPHSQEKAVQLEGIDAAVYSSKSWVTLSTSLAC